MISPQRQICDQQVHCSSPSSHSLVPKSTSPVFTLRVGSNFPTGKLISFFLFPLNLNLTTKCFAPLKYSRKQSPLYLAPILKEVRTGFDLPFLSKKSLCLLLYFSIELFLNLSSIISTAQSTAHWVKLYHVKRI